MTTTSTPETKKAPSEARVFLSHVAGLLVPGRAVLSHAVAKPPASTVGDLEGWKDTDLDTLIDEGRRTFDAQAVRFDRIRASAQVLLTTGTVLLVIIGSALPAVVKSHHLERVALLSVWAVGTLLVLGGTLGAAALLTIQSRFGTVLPTLVSQQDPPIKRNVALAYANQALIGEVTVATQITVYRDAVALVVYGSVFQLTLWLVHVL